MTFQKRYIYPLVIQDLGEKMVFVGGPRQVGKTTLAKMIAAQNFSHPLYLNWDVQKHKKSMLSGAFPDKTDLVILDELHKYYRWKNYIKGIFDTQRERLKILVTGSARLDVYRRGGDSLFGRYHHYRLHPFSVGELTGNRLHAQPGEKLVFPHPADARTHFESLLRFSGFPEPLFKQNEKALRRWHAAYVERLVRDEIRDLETVPASRSILSEKTWKSLIKPCHPGSISWNYSIIFSAFSPTTNVWSVHSARNRRCTSGTGRG